MKKPSPYREAMDYLTRLVGKPLCYGIKSPDMDLYDFGFGERVRVSSAYWGERDVCTHILHATCRFKIIKLGAEASVEIFDEDTPAERFSSRISRLVGLKVKRLALSDKNDLWLDFGDFRMVFATFENGEESWRYFTCNKDEPHLVASDLGLEFT